VGTGVIGGGLDEGRQEAMQGMGDGRTDGQTIE